MNKNVFFKSIFLILIVCCSCSNLTNKGTSKILPMDSVAGIVADCFFLEGEIYVKQWNIDTKNYSMMKYDSLFNKHGLTKEAFVKNYKYYITNEKYVEKFLEKVDEIVEQRVTAIRDSLDLE